MRLLNEFRFFLGEKRFAALLWLLLITGLASTAALFADQEWSSTVQTLAVLVFLGGAVGIIVSAMDGDQRYRWGAILFPAVLALLIGALIVPSYFGFAVGAALGWLVAGWLIFRRSREPMEYKRAVKAMRRGDLDEAVKAMDAIIKQEPTTAHHYRFRAELLRLAGKLPRAKSDYERMKNLAKTDTERAVAYNGMAEVDLQAKLYAQALKSAEKAYELAPDDWVTAYNLGMIQDRLMDSAGVLTSLTERLNIQKVPDVRHRLLIALYVARAHVRSGNLAAAEPLLKQIERDRKGLREWELLLSDRNATVLREVLGEDVALLKALLTRETTLEALA
ncbi:hypothetical protein CEN41_01770 [Fischerella thermalis CCMEE 5330]|uniref:Uncharacterized protein n=1 Tax=Fischerella thermalis CCMEE 5330 TaxID=2019670 RepID=A0A2N6MNF6_9CYAN|nr:hypothetical protein CEN41_01770 [Fischerella thermalis CCMEE 5330]